MEPGDHRGFVVQTKQRRDWPPVRVAEGLYRSPNGSFWIRPFVNGKSTWKKLASIALREAQREARALKTDHERAKLGLCDDPLSTASRTLTELAERYLNAGAPNSRLEQRHRLAVEVERARLANLLEYFGKRDPNEIRLKDLPDYAKWRMKSVKRGTGHRTVEMEWVSLSNVLNYGVHTGEVEFNYIKQNRPRLCLTNPKAGSTAVKIRHSREVAPASGDELHRIAAWLFACHRSEAIGWFVLFAAMTGCRRSELIRLRLDATSPEQPGFVSGNYLFVSRSKSGVNPYVLIHPALARCIEAHRLWHSARYSKVHWYFPGRDPKQPLEGSSVSHAMAAASEALQLPPRTPHGLRSFFATVRRAAGASDAQIAAEMGDRTVAVIHAHYGDRPANWTGGIALDWSPSQSTDAWSDVLAQSTVQSNVCQISRNSNQKVSDFPPSNPVLDMSYQI
jgi:integrase